MRERNIAAEVTVKNCLIDGVPVVAGDVILVDADTFRNLGDNGKKRLKAASPEQAAKAKAKAAEAAEAEEAAEVEVPKGKAKNAKK